MFSFTKTSESRHGFRIRAIFQIELHKNYMELLNNIQAFFFFFNQGIGFRISTKNNCMALKAPSLDDLKVIIAHFDKYPLNTKKQADF